MRTVNSLIGSPIERVEDLRFLRGRGQYVDDVTREGLLHAAILRSSVAHGRIRSIDTSVALALPGVQKPHCSAWCLRNDFCSGVRSRSSDRPSTVTILAPSACTASIRHDRTAAPSTRTVQAPHTPCSQPRCVPVNRS